jgi:anti-anti-sigma factor
MGDPSSTRFSAVLQGLDGTALVVLLGDLDMDTATELIRVLEPLVENGPSEIVLDFSGLSFIDSSGLAVLVRAQNRLRGQGRHLTIQSPRAQALRVLEVTNLSGLMGVHTESSGKSFPIDDAVTNA